MTGVQTCALPICFPVTIQQVDNGSGTVDVPNPEFKKKGGEPGQELRDESDNIIPEFNQSGVSSAAYGIMGHSISRNSLWGSWRC